MVYQRMIQSIMLLFTAGVTFAACGSPTPNTPQEKYCSAKCACNKCTPTESSTCLDDIINLGNEAKAADCKDPYDTYLSCLNIDGACTDGDFDEAACFNEETDLNSCIKPPAACATANNGVCDEPGIGDGSCAAGTDTMDCMALVCATTNDGICNEPAIGDGTCVTGSDTMDCMPAACASTNDGICDEPEGTATCAEGTDQPDCPCTKCFQYATDQPAGTLCDASKPVFTALYDCACGTCVASCGNAGDICDFGQLSSECFTCIQSLCSTSYMACTKDL